MICLACWICLHTHGQSLGEGFKLRKACHNVRASAKYYGPCCMSQWMPGLGHYHIQNATPANVLDLTWKNNSKTAVITRKGQKSTSPFAPKLTVNNPDCIKPKCLIDAGTASRKESTCAVRDAYLKFRKLNAKNLRTCYMSLAVDRNVPRPSQRGKYSLQFRRPRCLLSSYLTTLGRWRIHFRMFQWQSAYKCKKRQR